MNHFLFFIFLSVLITLDANAQSPNDSVNRIVADSVLTMDSLIQKDTIAVNTRKDSISKRPFKDSSWILSPGEDITSFDFTWQVMQRNPYFNFKVKPVVLPGSMVKEFYGKEFLFYLLIFLLIVFAFIRQLFPKYFIDLFRVFFRTTLKQRQIREQLMQTPLPSLLLNVFFVISGGLYITFLLEYFTLNPIDNFWLLFFYCSLGLSIAYMVKFVGLKITGWLFSITEAADSYIFIVFIINKMIGILLLPFLILLAFSQGDIYSISLTLSWCLIAGLFLYRFILTYSVIRNQVKVNPFHFFLYFCAFEIAPLLLVYRGLLLFFRITT